MTPAPSAEGLPKGVKLAVTALLAAVAGLYVSGSLYLWSIDQPPAEASPLTPLRYWHHHGHRPDVRAGLAWSLAAGMGLTFGASALALIPRRRPLHGDARFATRREIKRARLLGDNGIILGRLGTHYLMLPGQQGVRSEERRVGKE